MEENVINTEMLDEGLAWKQAAVPLAIAAWAGVLMFGNLPVMAYWAVFAVGFTLGILSGNYFQRKAEEIAL